MEFALDKAQVRLTHKNDRIETIGKDKILACDLTFLYETRNDILAGFSPDMRLAFYKRSDSPQGELHADPEHMTALRLPELGPVSVTGRLKGELKLGTGTKKDLVLAEVVLTKFKLECLDGGKVIVQFQAKSRPDETQAGRISGFLRDKHVVASFAPAEDKQRPLASPAASS